MSSTLNIKQWAVAAVVVFVVMSALEYILHGIILAPIYAFPVKAGLMRPPEEMSGYFKWVYLGYAFFAILFSYVYTRGHEGKPGIGEGIRYGFSLGLLLNLPAVCLMHAVSAWPRQVLIGWFFGGIIECLILGVIVSLIYKGQPKAA
jgi:hypothetical protein